jgi:hypothetical protein
MIYSVFVRRLLTLPTFLNAALWESDEPIINWSLGSRSLQVYQICTGIHCKEISEKGLFFIVYSTFFSSVYKNFLVGYGSVINWPLESTTGSIIQEYGSGSKRNIFGCAKCVNINSGGLLIELGSGSALFLEAGPGSALE